MVGYAMPKIDWMAMYIYLILSSSCPAMSTYAKALAENIPVPVTATKSVETNRFALAEEALRCIEAFHAGAIS